jgi:hypothetical protein
VIGGTTGAAIGSSGTRCYDRDTYDDGPYRPYHRHNWRDGYYEAPPPYYAPPPPAYYGYDDDGY